MGVSATSRPRKERMGENLTFTIERKVVAMFSSGKKSKSTLNLQFWTFKLLYDVDTCIAVVSFQGRSCFFKISLNGLTRDSKMLHPLQMLAPLFISSVNKTGSRWRQTKLNIYVEPSPLAGDNRTNERTRIPYLVKTCMTGTFLKFTLLDLHLPLFFVLLEISASAPRALKRARIVKREP